MLGASAPARARARHGGHALPAGVTAAEAAALQRIAAAVVLEDGVDGEAALRSEWLAAPPPPPSMVCPGLLLVCFKY